MSRFTYEIKKSGFNKVITVFDDGRQIYSNNSPTSTEDDLVRVAKTALRDNYGSDIDQMTLIPSNNPTPKDPINKTANSSASPTPKQTDKNAETIKKVKDRQKEKFEEAKKQQQQKIASIIKQAKSSVKVSKADAIALIKPALLSFITSKFTVDLLIDTLIRTVKKKFENEGILEIDDLTFTFTPLNTKFDYIGFKKQFDDKVGKLKNIINTLKSVINTLRTIIRIANITVTLLTIFIRVKLIIRQAQLISVSADLASPAQTKPIAASQLSTIINSISNLEDAKQKIEIWRESITTIQIFIETFSISINEINNKLNRLKFIINLPSNPQSNNQNNPLAPSTAVLSTSTAGSNKNVSDTLFNSAPDNEEYLGPDGKSYFFKLVTLPNGFRQYQALDSFSKFKIAQTAPSKIKSNQELLDEIKSIIG